MELFRLLGVLAIDTEEARRALDEASQQAEDTGEKTESAFGRIGTAASKLGGLILGAGAVMGGAFIAAVESTREYRTEMGKLDTAFQVAGHSSETAKDAYSDLNAVIGDSGVATEAANHLALLVDNEKDLATWTGDILPGVFATFGESIPLESLTESSLEVARNGQLTGGLVDALVWAGINEEEFQAKLDACNSEQERQQLIMSTLTEIYGEASTQYKETNKDVMDANRANEALADAFAEIGAVGEPILTAIKGKIAELVSAAVPLLESFIQKVKDLKQWIQDNEQTVNNWVAVIIGASVAIGTFLLILKWGAIMSAATKAIQAVRAAVLLFNLTLLANPIALIVAAIAGLVAAFIYLWNTNEDFRQFWIDLWEKIKAAGGKAIDIIKNKFNDFKGAFQTVKKVFGDIYSTITDKIESAKNKVDKAIQKIKGFFNITLKFKGIKMPKISISFKKGKGLAAKAAEVLGLEGVPSFSVKWNAEGGILTKPTIFGISGTTLLGGGEAGKEAVAPIDVLQGYVAAAVRAENEGIIRTLIEQNQLMMDFLLRNMPKEVLLDKGVLVGQLTPDIDRNLSDRWTFAERGNTR